MMDCLYVFLFLLHFSAGCDLVQNTQTLEVTGYSGESVALPCSCTEPLAKPEQLKWMKYYSENYKEIYPSEHIERYKNKVKLLNQNTPGNVSLLLSSLTKEDDGDYMCYVSSDKYIIVKLHVKGCDLVRQTLEVTGYLGESVALSCSCTEPLAKPEQLKWKYYTKNKVFEIYPSDDMKRYKNRVKLLNQSTPGNISLLLSSLTKEDDGYYQCSVSSDKYIDIRLHVKGCDLVQNTDTQVTGYLGESVALPCSCTEPLAKPEQLKWKYYTKNKVFEIYPSDDMKRYEDRVKLLNQTTPGNVSLLLSSLTKEDDGDYLCSVSSDKYIDIRLHVKEKHTIYPSTSQPSPTNKQTHELKQQPMHRNVFCINTGLSNILTPGDAEEDNI